MKKDGLLCLVFLIGKLEYYYPEIELKDANGKHIKSLDFIEEGKEITEENSSPVYLKAGTYKLEVKYFFEDDYAEDFDGESEEEDNDEDEPTSIRYELEYEIRCSAVEEDVSSSCNLKKTKLYI